jgi:uncharacterized protein
VRSLRERLAQFEPPPRSSRAQVPAPLREDALATLLRAGAVRVGEGPTSHLRIEAQASVTMGPPWEILPQPVWKLCATPVPVGDHWIVLDTETTGLESGTGTLVFLIGLLHWTSSGLRRVQLFLPEPAGEGGMLDALARELQDADALISYNGRAFDAARLRARLHLQRRPVEILDLPHLDLLVPVRRLLRRTLEDLRLSTIERHVLGHARVDDLPGEFAPEVYRTLQVEGRDAGLDAVLLHNARDIAHLPSVAAWIADALLRAPSGALASEVRLEVARLHALRGEREVASQSLRELTEAPEADVRRLARAELAVLLRRAGDYERAAAVWRSQIEESPSDLRARVEYAKLCEHRLRDLDAAQAAVAEAMQRDAIARALGTSAGFGEDLGHRLRRIRRKLARGAGRV